MRPKMVPASRSDKLQQWENWRQESTALLNSKFSKMSEYIETKQSDAFEKVRGSRVGVRFVVRANKTIEKCSHRRKRRIDRGITDSIRARDDSTRLSSTKASTRSFAGHLRQRLFETPSDSTAVFSVRTSIESSYLSLLFEGEERRR